MKLQEVMWCAGCTAEYLPIQLRRGKGCGWCERYAVTGDPGRSMDGRHLTPVLVRVLLDRAKAA